MKSVSFSYEKSLLERRGFWKDKELICQRNSDFSQFLTHQEKEREREFLKRMSHESLFEKIPETVR